MTLTNDIAQLATGNTVYGSDNNFHGVASTVNGQILQANSSATGYSYVNPYQSIPLGGYINETVINIGMAGAVQPSPMPLAAATNPITTTPYNPAAQAIAIPFTPQVSGSTMMAIVATSVLFAPTSIALQAAYTLMYLNGSGLPLFGNYLALTTMFASPKVGGLFAGIIGSSFTAGTTYNLNLCMYCFSSTNPPNGPFGPNSGVSIGGDYVKIIEFMQGTNSLTKANPASPVGIVTSSNSGQLITNFYIAANSSLMISGQWAAFDFTTSLTSNGGTFTLMAQSSAGGMVSIANSGNIIQSSILANGVAPYIYFQVSGSAGQLSLYGVGDGVNQYAFTISFTLN